MNFSPVRSGRTPTAAAKIVHVKAYVGVTDGNWYRFLASRAGITEINFWRPSSPSPFKLLSPGEPFFFKTKHPRPE
jgi:putative restriction endonuclease